MTSPWLDIAMSIELGDRVLTHLMTMEDWLDMIAHTVRPLPRYAECHE